MLAAEGYPKLADHQKLHAIYKRDFAEIAQRLATEGFNSSIMIQIQDKVVNWLLEHIAKVDADYGRYIDQKKNGKSRKSD